MWLRKSLIVNQNEHLKCEKTHSVKLITQRILNTFDYSWHCCNKKHMQDFTTICWKYSTIESYHCVAKIIWFVHSWICSIMLKTEYMWWVHRVLHCCWSSWLRFCILKVFKLTFICILPRKHLCCIHFVITT